MFLRDVPIRTKIMRVILFTTGTILLVMGSTFYAYEFFAFRHATQRQLSIQAKIIANNSTAALAFESREDATEILASLRAEPDIVVACLFDKNGNFFACYPPAMSDTLPSLADTQEAFRIQGSYLIGIQPVIHQNKKLGTLYIKSGLGEMYDRFVLYVAIGALVMIVCFALAYGISIRLQGRISRPILALAETARAISERKDYSVRASKVANDEIGSLTDSFNQMLREIQAQNAQIQSFNQQLEQTIEQRTHDLEVANKDLAAANQELEAFSYSVSHDLRAPLRSINGFARILIEDYEQKLDEDGKRTLHTIRRNGERMGELIDDLLNFSKLGRQNVTRVALDMNSLARSVAEDLRAQYDKKAAITIHPLQPITGDSSMLKQVMQNLISNALKYSMKKEQPAVEIGCYNENGSVVYYVKDNGAGFNMQYYNKLFGVFQRLHSANEFEGTGVGLALVHRIITKHGGKIWAEGKENQGATFYFSLPVV